MFGLFKKEPNEVLTKKQSVSEIIEEIHETFYTEVDKLLASAKISNSLDTDKQGLIEKCARLKALGFTNTKEVKEAELEIDRLDELKRDNEAKKTLIDAINYFGSKYPNYKFITEESVKKICAKYNLIYGAINLYTGNVPDKNLKHIEDFRILEDDECFIYKEVMWHSFGGESIIKNEYIAGVTKRIQREEQEKLRNMEVNLQSFSRNLFSQSRHNVNIIDMKCPLEIAAPRKDFNMRGMEVKDFHISKIEIPDPIVLKPVIFNGQKHYLIVTAWGDEASDPIVVNEKMN